MLDDRRGKAVAAIGDSTISYLPSAPPSELSGYPDNAADGSVQSFIAH